MNPPFSPLVQRLAGPRSRAWEVTDRAVAMERAGRQIIHLGVGDPDLETPDAVTGAAISALKSGRTHYSPISGEPELRAAIAESYARDFGVSVNADRITVFPGAQCALFATLLCLAGPGSEVMLLEPFYATYEGVARAGGASIVSIPLNANARFELDIELIKQRVTENTRVILTNSPGNPSGSVFAEASWLELQELCSERGIWLVSDEVYAGLVFEGTHVSPLALSNSSDNIIVISSVSKSHAMTGWRLGWAIAPPELTTHLANLAQCMLFGVNQFVQDAAGVALRDSASTASQNTQTFRQRRDTLCDALETIDGLVVHRPAGGMFVMVDVSRLGIDGETFANGLLDYSGVAVVPGFAFGDAMQNFVRIGYLLDDATLRRAADKIKDYVRHIST